MLRTSREAARHVCVLPFCAQRPQLTWCLPCAGAEGHAFCHTCWCRWLARKRTCPTCRGAIDEATPLIKNRLAERLVGELQSHCPFQRAAPSSGSGKRRRVEGCAWRGRLRDLDAHLATCEFALKPCSVSPLCAVSLPGDEIAAHEQACPHRRTLCFRCGRLVRVNALEHHWKSSKCHRVKALLGVYLELLKHAAECIAPDPPADAAEASTHALRVVAAPRPPRTCDRLDCLKMETLLRHYAKCSSRNEGGHCPSGVCDHITPLFQLHARDCTRLSYCPVPFCVTMRPTCAAATMQARPN